MCVRLCVRVHMLIILYVYNCGWQFAALMYACMCTCVCVCVSAYIHVRVLYCVTVGGVWQAVL